jgi:NADH:ubiquinone oxidoreductase subunit H
MIFFFLIFKILTIPFKQSWKVLKLELGLLNMSFSYAMNQY